MSSTTDPEEIEDLVARYVDLRESGTAPSAEAFARAHPSKERALRAALEALTETEALIPARDTTLPAVIGRYRVLEQLGRGGMGRVLRVEDPERAGVALALKLFEPPMRATERAAERFRREGELLLGLALPGVVRVLDVGTAGVRPYLVMGLVEGRSLAETLSIARERSRGGEQAPSDLLELPGVGPSWKRAAGLVATLARSLAAVHRAGIVHRDLKPANVIVTPEGQPVLVDFGLVHADSDETLTNTGDLLGTPQYMSPEQARGERADDRADVWGLGCILYELLTLQPPHTGSDPVRVLESVRRRPIVPLAKRAPVVPRDLARIVERALAHQRRFRTSNADLLAADLEAFCADRPVAARDASLTERLARAWVFRRGRILAAGGVFALAIAALPILELRADRLRAQDALVKRTAVEAFLAEDDAATLTAIERLSSEGRADPWNVLLEDLARAREPGASEDPAVAAAVEGVRLAQREQFRESLPHLRDAAWRAPREPLAGVLLARAAERAGELDLAAGEYAAASRLLPGSGHVEARLAQVHYAAKRYDDAKLVVERALASLPDHAESWHLLAKLLYRGGDFARGVDAAQRAITLAGTRATKPMRKNLAALLDKCERFDESQAILRALLDEKPDALESYLDLAFSYDLSHDVKAAHETYERAIALGPNSKLFALQAWLLSGASRKSCERCAAEYAKDPTLLDPDRSESLALDALACKTGREVNTPIVVAQIAVEIARPGRIRKALESMQDSETRDDRLAAITRALRLLK